MTYEEKHPRCKFCVHYEENNRCSLKERLIDSTIEACSCEDYNAIVREAETNEVQTDFEG